VRSVELESLRLRCFASAFCSTGEYERRKICVMETQWHDRSDIAGFSLSKELAEMMFLNVT